MTKIKLKTKRKMKKHNKNKVFLLIASICMFFSCNNSSQRDISFQGEYPPVEQITINNNGMEYEIEAFLGQVIVFFKENVSVKESRRQIKEIGGEVVAQMPNVYYYLVQVPKGTEWDFVLKAQQLIQVDRAFLHTTIDLEADVHIVDDFTDDDGFNHGDEVSKTAQRCCSNCNFAKPHDIYSGQNNSGNGTNEKLKEVLDIATDKPLLVNISLGKYITKYENGRQLIGTDGKPIKVKWKDATDDDKKIWISNYQDFLRDRIDIVKYYTNKDFIITKSAGNNGSPILDSEIINPLIEEYTRKGDQKALDVLNNHFLFVSAFNGRTETVESYSDRPNHYHSLVTATDISHLEYPGTSFAAPNALCNIGRIIEDYGLTGKEALQAVKDVTRANAQRNGTAGFLDVVELDKKAKEIAKNKGCGQEDENIDLSGEWRWVSESIVIDNAGERVPDADFTLEIEQVGNAISGYYMAVAMGGNRTDFGDGYNNTVSGDINGNIVTVTFVSDDWGGSGRANIKVLSENKIEWQITSSNGDHWAPKNVTLYRNLPKGGDSEDDYTEKITKNEQKNGIVGTKWEGRWEGAFEGNYAIKTLEFKDNNTVTCYEIQYHRYDGTRKVGPNDRNYHYYPDKNEIVIDWGGGEYHYNPSLNEFYEKFWGTIYKRIK